MLYFILVWTFLLITCCVIGTALLNLLKADCFERMGDRVLAAVWLGVIVLSISLLATAFVFPLSPLTGAIVTAGICSLSLLSKRTRNEMGVLRYKLSLDLILGFLTLEVLVAALTAREMRWIDTGLYHYNSIQWLSKFGVVPGIALLIKQLGFASSWFALTAPFNAEILESRASAITNGFVYLIALLQFLICLGHGFQNKVQISDWLVIVSSLILLPIVALNNLMSVILISPSPDLPVVFLVPVVAWAILIVYQQKKPYLEEEKASIWDAELIPLILSAGAVTIKLTALPLLFASGLYYIFCRGLSLWRVLIGAAVSLLLLSPMLLYGIITSGCPLYPSTFLCLDLPWSPSAQAVKRIAESTHGWTNWYGEPPPAAPSWLWLLWQWLTSNKLNAVMGLLIAISAFCALVIGVNLIRKNQITRQFWILALAASGIAFLMMTAPFFRFGLGYLILLPAFTIAACCNNYLGNRLFRLEKRLILGHHLRNLPKIKPIVALFLSAFALVLSIHRGGLERLLLPPQIAKVEFVQKQTNDILYLSPKQPGELCWAADLPCAFQLEETVKLRDPAKGIGAGFVQKK